MTADFIDRRAVEKGEVDSVQRQMIADMRARGTVWARITYLPKSGELVLEGWLEKPEDQGPEPT